MSALDQTVLNTSIPKLAVILNGVDRSAWIITSYLLFATFATPVAGKLADICGVKPVIICSTILFTVTSGLCGVAGFIGAETLSAMDQLIIFRGLQGIAGGAMIALCFVAIGDLFPSRERGKFQGVLAADFMIAAIIGPVLGGWLTDGDNWRFIFFLNLPIGLLATILFVTAYPKSQREKASSQIDWLGIVLFMLTITPVLLASNDIGASGSLTVVSTIEIVVSLVALVMFILREKSAKEPLVPMALFENRIVSISLATVFITGIGFFGSMLLMAMILQQIYHMSATATGAMLAPLMIVVAVSSIAGGWRLSKTGKYRKLIIAALVLMVVGTLILCLVSPSTPIWLVPLAGAIGGVGLGLMLPVHSIIIQNAVRGSSMGIATSLSSLFRSLGGTIGTGMMSALLLWLMKHAETGAQLPIALGIYVATLLFAIVINLFLPEIELKSRKNEPTSGAA